MIAHGIPVKYILPAAALCALCAGCVSMPRDTEQPQPRPLGEAHETMDRTPGEAPSASIDADTAATDVIRLERKLAQRGGNLKRECKTLEEEIA